MENGTGHVQRKLIGAGHLHAAVKEVPKPETGAEVASANERPWSGMFPSHSFLRGADETLPASITSSMGPRMCADFSKVRIHTDSHAHTLSDRFQARAFTLGSDIYFNRGEFQPETQDGRRLIAHELAHVKQQAEGRGAGTLQRQPRPGTSGPMTRQQFELEMRNRFGVFTIRTLNSEAEQRTFQGTDITDTRPFPNWQRWDPGGASAVYQDIVDAFEAVNHSFNGFPRVNEIVFIQYRYVNMPTGFQADTVTAAAFSSPTLIVYSSAESSSKGLPIARSDPSGSYSNRPAAEIPYAGDRRGAPIAYPSQNVSTRRFIIHELGHGVAAAARDSNYFGDNNPPDRQLIPHYRRAVGWQDDDHLFDIGVQAVRDAFAANTAPPAAYEITSANWNDPNWQEQPISQYMVSGGPGEDFAEAIMVFVENPTLLASRSPARHRFITSNLSTLQRRLVQPGSALQRLTQVPSMPPGSPPLVSPVRPQTNPFTLPSVPPRRPQPSPIPNLTEWRF
jgi:hypothetical protein